MSIDIGLCGKIHLTEEIARELYRMQSYNYRSSTSMAESPHPTERLMYAMAEKAIEMTLVANKTKISKTEIQL